MVSVILAGVIGWPAAPEVAAHGGDHYLMWDEGGSDFRVFGPNAAVTIWAGQIDYLCDSFWPVADIYVVGDEPNLGDLLDDVSPSPNTVFAASGGLFIEETIGYAVPSGQLTAGWYTVVYDECQDGVFGPEDTAFVDAFYVDLPDEIPPIDPRIAELKARAATRATTYDQYDELLDNIERLEIAYKIARLAQTCLVGPLAFAGACAAELAYGEAGSFIAGKIDSAICGAYQATFGMGCVKEQMKDVIADQRKHYTAIAADPPDSGFSVPASIDSLPFIPLSDPDALMAANLALTNAVATEDALSEALLHAIERYQGADAANDGRWALSQARAAQRIAILLQEQVGLVGAKADALESLLLLEASVIDEAIAMFDPFQDAVETGGFASEDERALRNLGLNPGAIAATESAIAAANVDGLTAGGLAAAAADLADATAPAVADLASLITGLDAVIAALESDPGTPADAPVADAGGPYAALEGSSVGLDATGSSSKYEITDYDWDLDGDGQFDDATGPTPTWTFPAAIDSVVGVRVTERHGYQDVDYARITIGESNRAPVTSEVPNRTTVEIAVGSTATFSIGVVEPDGDPVSVTWLLDDGASPSGSGSSYDFTAGPADVGLHTLAAFATDGRPDGGGKLTTWTVAVRDADADGDLWTKTTDCDDLDASVNPGRAEILLNGKDDDCNPGTSDDGGAPTASFVSSAPAGGRNVALYDTSLFATTPSAVSAIPVAQSPAYTTAWTMTAALNVGTEDLAWATTSAARFGVVSLWGGATWLIDRVAVMPRIDNQPQRVRDFAIDVSTTGYVNEPDWTQVLSATAADSAALQTFVLPGGPVPARYVRIRLLSNRGDPTYTTVEQFKVFSPQQSSGTTFTFEDRSADPDGDLASRLWAFGDGATSTLANPSHTFPGPGSYTVSLTVTDSRAHTSTSSLVHRVLAPPTGSFPTPAAINEKGSITTSGYSVSDPDGERIVRMTWNWGDGTAETVPGGSTAPTHQYQQDGVYTVRMTMTDAQEQVSFVDRSATVLNVPPTATLANQTVASGVRFNFTAVSSDVADPVTCTRDFGDGTPVVAGCGTQPHAYPALAAGAPDALYTQTLRVSDDDTTVTRTAVVTVTATFAHRTVPDELAFLYSPPAAVAGATGPATCSWDFGDGSAPVTGCAATLHAYPTMAPGAPDAHYPLTFRITDSAGTGALRSTITVKGDASAPFFSTSFNSGVPSQLSGITTIEPVQGFFGYGFDGSFLRNAGPTHSTSLTLTGLPAHTSIDLGFFLATIDSWDGNACFAGPDTFYVKINGVVRFSNVFENSRCGTQGYVPPTDVELARHLDLGFTGPGGYYTDSAYNMGFDPVFQSIPHTAGTLTIEWYSTHVGVATAGDESWGLDNVEVFLGGVTGSAPVADAGGPYATNEGTSVSLDGSGSSDADGDVLAYAWDLDDDGAFDDATGATTIVTPGDGPATMTVRLRVTDPGGASSTDDATIAVANVAPAAILSTPPSVLEGGSYTVALGGATDPSTEDAASLEYAFDCGLGAGYGSFSSVASTTCTAGDDDADAAVRAKVRDKDGGVSEYTATVPVLNASPSGTFGATTPILEGASSTLSWTGESDPSSSDAAALRHSFACDGLPASLTGSWENAALGTSTTCAFDDNGTYGVAGRLLDPDNASQTTGASVIVTNVAPSATFVAPASIAEGSTFAISLSGPTDPSTADTLVGFSYAFDCGDGADFSAFFGVGAASCPAPVNDGILAVGARIRDKDGGIRTYSTSITVTNVAPTAAATNDGSRPWGASVAFSATATDPSAADTASLAFTWDLDDDGVFGDATGTSASRSFLLPGSYTARVRVCDDDTCATASTTVLITKHATSLAIGGAATGAYSDPAGVSATLTDTTLGAPIPGATVGMDLGSQSASSVTNVLGIATPSIVLDQAAGLKSVDASFAATSLYEASTASSAYAVGPETAIIEYSGDTFATGTSVRLAATVTEAADGTLGVITRAWVTFDVFVGANNCGSGTPTSYGPARVVDTGTVGDGIGTAEVAMSTPGEQTYCIVARLTGDVTIPNAYYVATPSQYAVLTVVSTSGKFATGGGWIVDPGTGSHGNFGFTARFTKSGTPKGQAVYVWRSNFNGVKADFIVKSNSIIGLSFADDQHNGTFPWRAILDGKATIRINRASDGADLLTDGNATFRLVAVDSGQSSGIGVDSFAIRVLDKDGLEYKVVGVWNGSTYSSGILLSGGNTMVHLK